MNEPNVVGLDLSLTSTGIATSYGTKLIKSKQFGAARLVEISDHVMITAGGADLVVIEAFGYLKGPAVFIPELHGVIKYRLHKMEVPYVVVPQASLKQFATEKGNVGKDQMLLAAERRFGFEGDSNDEADAWLLYCMGLVHYMVLPPWKVTQRQLDALKKIQWPEINWPGEVAS